jgi:GNAT superfamily N-acetyltransferase
MSTSVRRLGPDDWQTWRDVRLAALADAPGAFASSLAKERDYDEAAWRDRLHPDRGLKAVAGTGTALIGLVGAWVPEDRHGAVELYSMWVERSWRGRGVGDLLVAQVLDWAREHDHERVDLWIVEGNETAERLYRRHGFRLTDESQPYPNNPDLRERVMTRRTAGEPQWGQA